MAARKTPKPVAPKPTTLLIATRKGLWVLGADAARRSWKLTGPHFLGHIVHHAIADPRDPRTLLAAARTGDVQSRRAQARIRRDRARLRLRSGFEPEQIAVEANGTIEVGHDRTDVAGAGDRRRSRRCAREQHQERGREASTECAHASLSPTSWRRAGRGSCVRAVSTDRGPAVWPIDACRGC